MIRSIRRVGLLVVAAAALLAGTAVPASAWTETTANPKRQYLTAFPWDGMATSCHTTRRSLVGDDYVWAGWFHSHVDETILEPRMRSIRLGAGDYTWTDCLKPKDGYYIHTSTLDPDNPAWETASVSQSLYFYRALPEGDTTWGSQLIRQT